MKTPSALWIAISLLILGLVSGASGAGQNDKQGEALLQAAKNLELVKGDLNAAIDQYKKILSRPDVSRPVAATALLEMGRCYEKLGQAEARSAYEQLVKQFPDQTEQAQAARTRLVALAETPSLTAGTDIAIRRVWSGSGVDTSGSPSPDGRYLTVSDIGPGAMGDLTVLELASGRMRRLTNKVYAYDSVWSPDGGRIVYTDLMGTDFELKIIGSDGSGSRTLAKGWSLDWSRDGRFILAIDFQESSKRERLALISVADGSLKILGTTENPIDTWSAGFSADGKYVVYELPQQEGATEPDIFIIPIDGKQGIPLVRHPAIDRLLGWVPGSDFVLFSSDRSGTQDAWALHVADGKPQGEPVLIRKQIGPISPLGFTREGSFYYTLQVSIEDVYETSLDLAKGIVLEPPKKIIRPAEGINSNAEWSPDGKYLAYVSERPTGSQTESSYYIVCIRSNETGEVREVTPPILSPFFQIHWSADGRALFAAMADKTIRGLFKIDIQTGEHALVVQPDHFTNLFRSFAVSPDGKSVYYQDNPPREKLMVILRHDLETGQKKEVYRARQPFHPMFFSSDGRYLAFSTAGAIRILPAAGGETRDLFQGQPGESVVFGAWTPDGKSILFFKSTADSKDKKRELWQVELAGGEPRKIDIDIALPRMHLHPDGRRIAFSVGQSITEIWVMENFLRAIKAMK